MDVRRIEDVAPVLEHNDTTSVWWLIKPREMYDATVGGYLELICEWEIAGGGEVFPHRHPTHEFYYVTSGRGLMRIGDEEQIISPGDLVYIPPDALHSVRTVSENAPLHAVSFAVGVPGTGAVDYTTHDD
jgi:quercetin dioxygenase-like cupin family protein